MQNLIRFFGVIVLGCAALSAALVTVKIAKSFWTNETHSGAPQVAVVDLSGTIFSSATFVKRIDNCLEKKNIKAIVVRINSPGGLVGPSQEMYDAIRRADAKIPVIASMGSVAASGGYYAALGARKIFANAGTLTASIGVIMEFANTQKLFEWAKIQRFTLTAGRLKDIGSPYRPMTSEEKTFLSNLLADIHKHFRGAVKERRKLTEAELENTADGRIMTGSQAMEAKLVDSVGGFTEAVKEAKKLANLPEDTEVDLPEKRKGILRDILLGEEDPESGESTFHQLVDTITFQLSRPGWRVMLLAPTL